MNTERKRVAPVPSHTDQAYRRLSASFSLFYCSPPPRARRSLPPSPALPPLHRNYPTNIIHIHISSAKMRVEAARLVRALCNGSDLTLQTLISCGGLSVLAQFLGAGPRIDGTGSGGGGSGDGSTGGEGAVDGVDDARRLVRIGIDGVLKVFSLQRIRRNDFCKLFLRLGLMPRVMVRERRC